MYGVCMRCTCILIPIKLPFLIQVFLASKQATSVLCSYDSILYIDILQYIGSAFKIVQHFHMNYVCVFVDVVSLI